MVASSQPYQRMHGRAREAIAAGRTLLASACQRIHVAYASKVSREAL